MSTPSRPPHRGGKICLTDHFKPLWARNVPKFGLAHLMALGVSFFSWIMRGRGRVHDLTSTRNVAETKGVTVLPLGHALESLGRRVRCNKGH